MRELKLRYFIDLASNIAARAQADARALQESHKVMQQAIAGTSNKLTDWNRLQGKSVSDTRLLRDAIVGTSDRFTQLDRAIARVGTNTSVERQANYMRQLARSVDDADRRVRTLKDRLSTGWKTGAIAGAGAVGAFNAVRGAASDALGFDERLAQLANTAYSDQGREGRLAGMKKLEAAINAARRASGGTREQAAEALDEMVASGVVSTEDSMSMLPSILKAAVASGASPKEMATIALRAQKTYNIPVSEMPSLLSGGMAAGQAGGFELKDMAKWLPQQMAMSRNLGMKGAEDFAKLAAWNQAAIITAGTKDEAGNNLRDLLNELNTPHFRKFMAEQYLGDGQSLKKGQKAAKQKQIDEVFLGYQEQGVDKVSATIDMMDKVFARDKRYAELQGKLKSLPKDDRSGRQEILEAMAAQVQGTATGKVFHNQQSLMAFLGIANNREYAEGVRQKVRAEFGKSDADSAVGVAHSVVASTASYKLRQAEEDKKMAEKAGMDKATPGIGWASEMFSKVVAANPSTAGMSLLMGSAGIGAAKGASLGSILLGLIAGGAAGAGAAGGAAPAAAAASGASRLAGLMRFAGPLALAGSGVQAGMILSDDQLDGWGKARDLSRLGVAGAVPAAAAFFDMLWPKRDASALSQAAPVGGAMAGVPRLGMAGLGVPQLDLLTLTAPNAAPSSVKAGQTAEVKVGEGRLGINITVRNETVSVVPTIEQQPSLVKLDVGRTNPGSN